MSVMCLRLRGWRQDLLTAAICTCGHPRGAHRHYRRGTDCALCDCSRWSPSRWWRRFLARPVCLGRVSPRAPRSGLRAPRACATGPWAYLMITQKLA
jgi:hypothetical protein